MVEIFESLAQKKRVVAVSRDIPEDGCCLADFGRNARSAHLVRRQALAGGGPHDGPTHLRETDPPHAADYERRAADYLAELDRLDAYCRDRAAEVPDRAAGADHQPRRVSLFRRAYGFEVVGIQGISTDTRSGTARRSPTPSI